MGRREDRRIGAAGHERTQPGRRVAADDHLNIGKFHAPFFERKLKRQIIGAAKIENVDFFAAQILWRANVRLDDEGIRKLVV